MASNPSDRVLRLAAVCFAVSVLVHNSDHLRRGGDSVATDGFVLGTAGMVLEVAVVALVLMKHRLGPLVAASAIRSICVDGRGHQVAGITRSGSPSPDGSGGRQTTGRPAPVQPGSATGPR